MKIWYIKNDGVVERQPTVPQPEIPAGIDAGITAIDVVEGRVKLAVLFSNQTTLEFEFDASVQTLIQDIESSIQYHTNLL